jgi:hypothetical protein
MAEDTPTQPESRGYERPKALYMSLNDSLTQERGRSFSPAFTEYLQKEDPALYAELCAADDAGQEKEVGPYTREQLHRVETSLTEYTSEKFVGLMKECNVQNADLATFDFSVVGQMQINLPGSYPFTLVQIGRGNWTLNGLVYKTSAEEVFEDVADLQKWASDIESGTLASAVEEPFTISPSGFVLFDYKTMGSSNTFEASDLAALQGFLNGMYKSITQSAPNDARLASSHTISGTKETVAKKPERSETEIKTVRDRIQAHPETVMDGDKKSFVFNVARNSPEDLYGRIENIYSTEEDHQLTLNSSRYPDRVFKYDTNRGSFYEFKDGGFTDQRLVLRAKDHVNSAGSKTPPAAPNDAPKPVESPKEEVKPLSEKDSVALVASLHELRGQAEAQLRALEGSKSTRTSNPEGWQKLDGTYHTIQILFATKGFDLNKVPVGTPYLEEVKALQEVLPSRFAALGIPEKSPAKASAVAQKPAGQPAPTEPSAA